eukprot:359631_1
MATRMWLRVSSMNFEDLFSNKLYLFDPEQLKTLRFAPEELQKRDILISGYLREQTKDELYFPMVIVHLILIRLPKFQPMDEVKLVIGGYLSSGKTSLIRQVTDHTNAYRFRQSQTPTLGSEFYTNRFHNKLMDRDVRLNVRDLSGHKRYKNLVKIHFRNADITIIVYDITKYESLQYGLDLIDNQVDKQSTVVLVGNKLDLKKERRVNKNTAMSEAEDRGIAYFEVTATEYDKVENMFQQISNMMMRTFPRDNVFVR